MRIKVHNMCEVLIGTGLGHCKLPVNSDLKGTVISEPMG